MNYCTLALLLALIANGMSISLPGKPDPSTSCNQLLEVYGQVMALQTASDITQTAQSLLALALSEGISPQDVLQVGCNAAATVLSSGKCSVERTIPDPDDNPNTCTSALVLAISEMIGHGLSCSDVQGLSTALCNNKEIENCLVSPITDISSLPNCLTAALLASLQ